MIYNYSDLKITNETVKFKKSRQYSSDFTFIPIKYKNKELVIQTPHCFVSFGINTFSKISNKRYLDLSIQSTNQ